MKLIIAAITSVLIFSCAGQPVQKQAQYEIAYINVLEFYKGELEKCFDVNENYIPTCPVSNETMEGMGDVQTAYDLAISHEVTNPCNISKLVAQAAVLVDFAEVGSLNISGFCAGSEIDDILGGE